MDKLQINRLIEKYRQGTADSTEIRELERWYQSIGYKDSVYPDQEEMVQQRMLSRLQRRISPPRKSGIWSARSVGAAAAVILVLFTAGYFFSTRIRSGNTYANDIRPGSNRATLTLANGKVINLSDAVAGKLSEESGVSITKTQNGQIVYQVKSAVLKPGSSGKGADVFNTIATPRGGQYQVIMPDGTKVWLNSASVLKFPSSFEGAENRRVELTGEAYFEVAKDKKHTFIVQTNKQVVEVLGTHFNINSYNDEGVTKTTLLEGSVKVSKLNASGNKSSSGTWTILKPDQQAVLNAQTIEVIPANAEQSVAWKNALFVFDHDNLESIMRKISRWYDVEIVYIDEEVKGEVFSGKISRFENVSEVLKKLALTGAAKFKIERRQILVMK